jgi:antitoxin VapB
MDTAKVFWTGHSQAIRLPKAFRVEGNEVRIRRHGSSIILEPVPTDWSWLDALPGRLDADAIEGAQTESEEQERPGLDRLFGR